VESLVVVVERIVVVDTVVVSTVVVSSAVVVERVARARDGRRFCIVDLRSPIQYS
jgi:hypothetical protein